MATFKDIDCISYKCGLPTSSSFVDVNPQAPQIICTHAAISSRESTARKKILFGVLISNMYSYFLRPFSAVSPMSTYFSRIVYQS